MSKIARHISSWVLVLSLAPVAFADTLRLKDGSILKGKIVSFGSGKFTVAIGEGSRRREFTFMADEVESIQFDAPGSAPVTNRTASYNQPAPETKKPTPPKVVTTENTPTTPSRQPGSTNEKITPIEWQVKVLADNTANGWTNSGWVVKKGQRIRVTGDGTVMLGKGRISPAAGNPDIEDSNKLLKNVATGALIAVIGDDNNDFIYIGAEREFTATRDGALFLGINEGHLDDNSGSFTVKVEILP